MKLVSLNIEKLFGRFDYTINLNQKENITILTGPNGYGKTTILNIIHGIFNLDLTYLKKLPFIKIALFSNEDYTIFITRKKERFKNISSDFIVADQSVEYLGTNPEVIVNIELRKKSVSLENIEMLFEGPIKDETKISTFIKNIHVYFIKDQRLFQKVIPKADGLFRYDGTIKADGEPVEINTIKVYSNDLCNKVKEKQTEEKKLADELAPSLTKRFKNYKTILSASEYQERFQKVSQKYKKLQEYGIYQNDLESTEYEGDDRRFFSLNLEDWEKKTAVFDDLLAKLNLFVDLLKGKSLTNKKVSVDADKGFVFRTADGEELELSKLSSGEQNQTILLYELLFKADPGSLVLIDEPETSLHVSWQHEFLHDLEKIISLNPISFLIATHSPSLINEHWGWAQDLFDKAEGL